MQIAGSGIAVDLPAGWEGAIGRAGALAPLSHTEISAPTVTVITEAPGLAPEEVELLVTFPLESAINGAPQLHRLRSVSAAGISVLWAEFESEADLYRARQIVAERLPRAELPSSVERPQLGPMSSILGEITFVALTSEPGVGPGERELRRLADVVVRRRLLAVPGIAQVVPIGGEVRQVQVELDPSALRRHRTGLAEVVEALERTGRNPAAGFHVDRGQEYLVRGRGRPRTAEDFAQTVVPVDGPADGPGGALRVGELGEVRDGDAPRRGTAAFRGRPAVVLSVQKQPEANTLALTRELDLLFADLQASLPEGVVVESETFRQADFIEVAVANVTAALRDGAVLVVLVLILFLGNWRATLVSAMALPLALTAGALTVVWIGGTLNTMTLGGLTIAVGALVDDAIIDVENVVRRLREERRKPPGERRGVREVVFTASVEVRRAILFATLILLLVLVPLFVLPSLEGRLLRPLGLAYAAALVASLVVSMTVTPVLCSLLFRGERSLGAHEPRLLALLGRLYGRTLDAALVRPGIVLAGAALALVGALALVPGLGRSFLPPFNEGALTIGVTAPPGIPLEDSDALGGRVEEILLGFPEVVSTTRRTGRAEKDEHVQGINRSEIEVVLAKDGRSKEDLLRDLRAAVAEVSGVEVSFGQPISHRIDHMLSGSRTNLAVKVFGPDPAVLRSLSGKIEQVLQGVPGIVDLSNQEQASVPQLLIDFDRRSMARYQTGGEALDGEDLARTVEALFQGTPVGEILEDGLVVEAVARFPASLRAEREHLDDLPVAVHGGRLVRLGDVAEVRFDLGPSMIRREDVERLAMLTANVEGADLAGTVERARDAVAAAVTLPTGYRIAYGGQFEEAERGAKRLFLLGGVILLLMGAFLHLAFRDARQALIVLVNLPLALVGGVAMVAWTDGVLSVATLVGFVTLFGVATRNGVLLVSRYQDLLAEGAAFEDAVRRGSLERLAPILMTALTAALALVPLLLAGGEPGNEIQSPMARVLVGGLVTSTALNLLVVPVLFARWARPKGEAG